MSYQTLLRCLGRETDPELSTVERAIRQPERCRNSTMSGDGEAAGVPVIGDAAMSRPRPAHPAAIAVPRQFRRPRGPRT